MVTMVFTDDRVHSFCFEFYVLPVLEGMSQVPLLPEAFLDHLTRNWHLHGARPARSWEDNNDPDTTPAFRWVMVCPQASPNPFPPLPHCAELARNFSFLRPSFFISTTGIIFPTSSGGAECGKRLGGRKKEREAGGVRGGGKEGLERKKGCTCENQTTPRYEQVND